MEQLDFKHLRKEIDKLIETIENSFESFKNDNSYAYFVGQRTDNKLIYYYYNIDEKLIKKISLNPINLKYLNVNYLTFRFIKKETNNKLVNLKKIPLEILKLREKKQKYNFNPFEYEDVQVEKFISCENIIEQKEIHIKEIFKQFIAFEFRKIGFSYEEIIKDFDNFSTSFDLKKFILPEYTYIFRDKKIKLKKLKVINI